MQSAVASIDSDDGFDRFAEQCRSNFLDRMSKYGPHLFVVDAGDLYSTYLSELQVDQRQVHTCSCCKQFIDRFGSLAFINGAGQLISAIWSGDAEGIYSLAGESLRHLVEHGKVTGVFLSAVDELGTPQTGEWSHFSLALPRAVLYRAKKPTAGQAMAQKHEDFGTLSRGLAEFKRETCAQAVTLLRGDALNRSEKVLGPASWLLNVHDMIRGAENREHRENIKWLAVAGAPAGFCTPRSTMIGTVLEDIEAGKSFEQVKQSFAAKMHPLRYQRPQAAPSMGNIAAAEKLVEELGIGPSLERRFARLDEIEKVWTPSPVADQPDGTGGVFGHLKARVQGPTPPLEMAPQTVTWVKFARDVLPIARKMSILMQSRMNFCALVTAVNADAPPILQWDREERRNPVSWYVYHNGSGPSDWGLMSGDWVPVTAIALQPSMWGDADPHGLHGKSAILLLEGAKDQRNSSLALFPETLRSVLNPARATIEAHSKSKRLAGEAEASANGIRVGQGNDAHRIRVTTSIGVEDFHIDRWE